MRIMININCSAVLSYYYDKGRDGLMFWIWESWFYLPSHLKFYFSITVMWRELCINYSSLAGTCKKCEVSRCEDEKRKKAVSENCTRILEMEREGGIVRGKSKEESAEMRNRRSFRKKDDIKWLKTWWEWPVNTGSLKHPV